MTNFRFVLEDPPTKGTCVNATRPLISPYTGPNAVVSVPIAVKSLTQDSNPPDMVGVLDDYSDLQAVLSHGLRDGSAFRIVLESYDATLVKDHIVRLRSLFEGNVPTVLSLDEAGEAAKEMAENSEEKKDSQETKADKEAKDLGKDPPKNMPFFPTGKSVAPDVASLRDFFYLACGEDPSLYSEDCTVNQESSKQVSASKSSKKKKGKDKPNESLFSLTAKLQN